VTQREFFELVVRTLEDLGIPYMVTGSVGAMLYGEPRMTNDMDVVLELTPSWIDPLLSRFPPAEFCSPPHEVVLDEIHRRGQFNIIHSGSGSKVDLILRKTTDFAEEEFSRRRPCTFTEEVDCQSASPEDIILSKLLSFREGGSEKHLRDIRGVLGVMGDAIDREYILRWVGRLGLTRVWERVRDR
jgi:hypothetical protein